MIWRWAADLIGRAVGPRCENCGERVMSVDRPLHEKKRCRP